MVYGSGKTGPLLSKTALLMKCKLKCKIKGCQEIRGIYRDVCSKHHMQQVRKANPMKCCYTNLKANAKRRGHAFLLTYQEFEEFCIATDYIAGKGRTRESYSIDRIDPTKGYQLDNIQRMTVSENSKKKNHLHYDWQTGTAVCVKSAPIDQSQNIF